jgi:hypothetical protein
MDTACLDCNRSLVNNCIDSLLRAVMLVGARTTDAYPFVERLISKQCVEVVASASCECSELGLGSYHPHQILEPLTWVEFHCHGMGYIGLHWAPA